MLSVQLTQHFDFKKAYRLLKDLTSSYNRMIRPNYYGKSSGVGIELYILGIPSVDDEKMELSLDMYFRQVRLNKEMEFGLKVLL